MAKIFLMRWHHLQQKQKHSGQSRSSPSESKDKLDKRIADSKAELQAQKDKFVNEAAAANANAKRAGMLLKHRLTKR
jgi:hypothetical protein